MLASPCHFPTERIAGRPLRRTARMECRPLANLGCGDFKFRMLGLCKAQLCRLTLERSGMGLRPVPERRDRSHESYRLDRANEEVKFVDEV